jgi:hypothetical protein
MIPLYIGSQLSVIYLFSYTISSEVINLWQKNFSKFILATLACLSIASCISISQADTWWNKGFEELYKPSVIAQSANQKIINDINKLQDSLLISDSDSGTIMSLSHRLSPQVNLMLIVQPNKPLDIPDKFTHVFLFSPSNSLKDWFINKSINGVKYKLESINNYGDSQFWRLLK